MIAKKRARSEEIAIAVDSSPKAPKLTLNGIGGSQLNDWNNVLANQALNTLWLPSSEEFHARQRKATLSALAGICPRDEIEGMIAAQLLAAHNAAMECYRRAMIPEQSIEGRRENLNQANKLSRTYSALLEALNRHRGKGEQKVTVEHVHVHGGGQAVVGMVENPGGGDRPKSEEQPYATQIARSTQPPVWGSDPEREPVPVTGDAERPLPNARRKVARGSKGKS
jgi:hypothetical protein